MSGHGHRHGGSHYNPSHRSRSESHRHRQEDDLEEGEIDSRPERSSSSRHRHDQPSGSGSSRRHGDRREPSRRQPISPLVAHSQGGGTDPLYVDPQPHQTNTQHYGSEDAAMSGAMPIQPSDQYQAHPQEDFQHEPFYSSARPPQQQTQYQAQATSTYTQQSSTYSQQPTFTPQMTSSQYQTPSLSGAVSVQQQYADEQYRQGSYDPQSYGNSRQGTQGSVSGTSPQVQFAPSLRSGPGQQRPSHMANPAAETGYRGDAGQPGLPATGGAMTNAYSAGQPYPSAGGPNWQAPPQFPAAGDTSGYPGYPGYGAYPASPAGVGTGMGVDMTRPSTDSHYQGYPDDSQYYPSHSAGGTTSRPVRGGDISPPDSGPEGQPRRRHASSSQHDRNTYYEAHPGDYRGNGYSDTYLPAQGQNRPAPSRRDSTTDSTSTQYPQSRGESFNRHTSSSSIETVRDRNGDRDRNRRGDRDRDGDRMEEGATDRREQHGDTYYVGQPRGPGSSRTIQSIDSAFGPSAGNGSGGNYPSAIQEEYEGEDYAGGGGSGRGGGGYSREYEAESGGYGAARRTSRHHGSGGGSRRRRE